MAKIEADISVVSYVDAEKRASVVEFKVVIPQRRAEELSTFELAMLELSFRQMQDRRVPRLTAVKNFLDALSDDMQQEREKLSGGRETKRQIDIGENNQGIEADGSNS